MKPAPPVIIIFLTSGNGSNFVVPVRIGAFFQTPKSSKNLVESPLSAVHRQSRSVTRSNPPVAFNNNLRLTSCVGCIVRHGEVVFIDWSKLFVFGATVL
jgi:hypothetical protein